MRHADGGSLRIEGFPVVTNDAAIRAYGVQTIW
jgi:hypothetical protein